MKNNYKEVYGKIRLLNKLCCEYDAYSKEELDRIIELSCEIKSSDMHDAAQKSLSDLSDHNIRRVGMRRLKLKLMWKKLGVLK